MAAQKRHSFDINNVYYDNTTLLTINSLAKKFAFELKEQQNVKYITTRNNILGNEPKIGKTQQTEIENLKNANKTANHNKVESKTDIIQKLQSFQEHNIFEKKPKELKNVIEKKHSRDDSLIVNDSKKIKEIFHNVLKNLNTTKNTELTH
jgi:hypothetical protein